MDDENDFPSNLVDTNLLLMNKKSFKHLSQTGLQKNSNYANEFLKYKSQILDYTENKLLNPDNSSISSVDESFNAYVTSLIRHFKQKEVESLNNFNKIEDLDEELEDSEYQPINNINSFWSKHKVIKK
jgi:hypothetical protein|tara:strand:- start:1192 stop:1575 length:384 start_codon:yes stop_codon:yes gene_type:complete